MRVNVENMLRQVAHEVGRRYGYAYSLEALSKNLKNLRDRSLAGEGQAALDEFFSFYVFGDNQSGQQHSGEQKP